MSRLVSSAHASLMHERASAAKVLVFLFVAIVSVTGCTSQTDAIAQDPSRQLDEVSISGFENVRAQLDFATATATTPISPYLLTQSFDIEVLFSAAREKVVQECMAASGEPYTGFSATKWDQALPMEDRLFGMWDTAAAAKYGAELNPTRGVRWAHPAPGTSAANALAGCQGEVMKDPSLRSLAERLQQPNIADRIMGSAASWAQNSKPGKTAMKKFHSCLKKRGIVIDPSSGYVSGHYAQMGKEASIMSSTAEAECNINTGRIELLYKLRAQYEAALMKKYEAQLSAAKKQKQEIIERLKGIIDRG